MTDTLDAAPPTATGPVLRSYAIDDLVVRSDGDGRTVEAYMAVFNQPTEIQDQYGHYYEVIDRSAFNGVIKRNAKPLVMFNHGRDMHGTRSDYWSTPVAVHRSMEADGRGVRVSSWYVQTPKGDEALELIRSGAVDGYSFSGKPNRSQPIAATNGDLPTIVRQDMGLVEYGPAILRAYEGARVLALRSESTDFDPQELVEQLERLNPDQLAELVPVLRSSVPDLADLIIGRSETPGIADGTAPSSDAASEFDIQRRQLAARLRGLTPHDHPGDHRAVPDRQG